MCSRTDASSWPARARNYCTTIACAKPISVFRYAAKMDIRVEAPNLLRRYQEGAAFRQYVQRRTPLVFAALVVMLTLSLATTAGMVVYFGDIHTWRVLAGLILAPFLLAGSLFVQGFVFFSWLEQRALDEVSGRTRPPREQIPP